MYCLNSLLGFEDTNTHFNSWNFFISNFLHCAGTKITWKLVNVHHISWNLKNGKVIITYSWMIPCLSSYFFHFFLNWLRRLSWLTCTNTLSWRSHKYCLLYHFHFKSFKFTAWVPREPEPNPGFKDRGCTTINDSR